MKRFQSFSQWERRTANSGHVFCWIKTKWRITVDYLHPTKLGSAYYFQRRWSKAICRCTETCPKYIVVLLISCSHGQNLLAQMFFIVLLRGLRVRFMVFNATFNNISVISWRSVLLMEETRVPRENHRPVVSHCQTLSHNVISSTPCLSRNQTHNVSGDRHWLNRYWGSYKSNNYMITTTTASFLLEHQALFT